MKKEKCRKCGGTGVIDTGNNDLPCDCPAGDKARFHIAGVSGSVSGKESKLHFLNGCSQPVGWPKKNIKASNLPGRNKK